MTDLELIAQVLIDLEHHDMTADTDQRYQLACAITAQRLVRGDLWAELQRAACECHHCGGAA